MKTLYIVLGSISLALGILGIFLPLLPTTPFLLLTAALYFKGSPRLYNWLLNHRHFGPYIRNFRENKAIPLRAKIISLVLMWGTMLYCIFFPDSFYMGKDSPGIDSRRSHLSYSFFQDVKVMR